MGRGKGGGAGGKKYSGGPRRSRLTAYQWWLYYNRLAQEAAALEQARKQAAKEAERQRKEAERQRKEAERQRKEAERQRKEEQRLRNAERMRRMAAQIQSEDDNIVVKVRPGSSKDRGGQATSDFVIIDKREGGWYTHLVIGDDGKEIYREYNPPHEPSRPLRLNSLLSHSLSVLFVVA